MVIKSNCRICACNCGIEVEVEDNKVIDVKGDKDSFSKGFICKKSLSYGQNIHAHRKFDNPMIRNENGDLVKATWDEAIDFIGNRLSEVIKENGGKSVAFHSGENYDNHDISDMAKLFLNAIDSPNFSDSGTYCNLARDLANRMNHGFASTKSDFENSKAVVLWGSNPRSSTPRYAKEIEDAKKNGASTVVIDPVENKLAQEADLYLQIRPGSDGALALGVMNLLFERGAVDEDLWNDNSVEFSKFKEYVKTFDPITVETITWISGEDIEKLADIYQNSESLTSSIGVAIELQTNAVQSIRAIVALDMVAGFYNKKGGNLSYPDLKLNEIEITSEEKPLGFDEFPLLSKYYGISQMNRLTRSVLDKDPYPISALIVHNSNPALNLPNTNKVVEALEALDLLVVIDNRLTDTAEMADVVLPMTNIYERLTLRVTESTDGVYLALSEPILEAEVMTESELFVKIAEKLNVKDKLSFDNDKDILENKLKGIGHSLDSFKENNMIKVEDYNNGMVFNTPSAKAEFYSSVLEEDGYEPLPVFVEPEESMLTTEYNPEFIFTATTGTRAAGAEIAEDGTKQKVAQAHRAVIDKFHKHDGDLVTISSPRGSIEMIVRESDRICPNTISIPQSTRDQNPNVLVDNEVLDPIIGFPGCRSFLIKFDHEH